MVEYDNKNWLGVIFRLHGSVLPALATRIVIAGGIGAGAALLHARYGFKMPPIAHQLLGLALGLLLVFRTNASYDRWWEGRRLLGAFINRARDLARQTAAFIDGDDEVARKDRLEIARLVGVMFALMRQYLRKERDLGELGERLTAAEREALEPVAVRPNLAALWLSRRLAAAARAGRLSEQRLQLMDANVTAFLDYLGGAERILKTPIPFAYAQHIKSFLALFCFTAPFAMVEAMRWYTPLAAGILAYGMFGIDEIGVEIEDPFGYDPNDLPLDKMNATVDENARAIVEESAERKVA